MTEKEVKSCLTVNKFYQFYAVPSSQSTACWQCWHAWLNVYVYMCLEEIWASRRMPHNLSYKLVYMQCS